MGDLKAVGLLLGATVLFILLTMTGNMALTMVGMAGMLAAVIAINKIPER